MNRLLILIGVLFLTSFSLFSQNEGQLQTQVFFAVDKSDLTNESKGILTDLVKNLKNYPYYSIVVKGNTDADGSNTYNQKLSERRVNAVKSFLIGQTISVDAFKTEALGEDIPIADNTTNEGKSKNRRVDITVHYRLTPPLVAEPQNDPLSITGLFQQLRSKPQEFIISNDRDTFLLCAKGSLIVIPAGSFDVPVGTVLKFSVKEVLSMEDMIFENLTTTSQDKPLNSGGMIRLDAATLDGKMVDLKPNRSLGVKIPTTDFESQMQYFSGTEPKNETEQVDWKLMENAAVPINGKTKKYEFKLPNLKSPAIMTPVDNRRLAGYVFENFEHFDEYSGNFYRILLNKMPFDTCRNLYTITEIEKTDSIKKLIPEKGLASAVKQVFTGSPKTTVVKEARTRTVKEYHINTDLSKACVALAHYGKENNLERMGWEAIHRSRYSEIYAALEGELKTRDYSTMMTILREKATKYDVRLADFKVKYDAKMAQYRDENDAIMKKWHEGYNHWMKKQEEEVTARLANGNISKGDINFYFFETNHLGWLNCDYFANNTDPVLVDSKIKKSNNIDTKIVFQDRMAAMPANGGGENFTFKNVPKGRKAWIIAMAFHTDGPSLAIQEFKTGDEIPEMTFKKLTIGEMRAEISRLKERKM